MINCNSFFDVGSHQPGGKLKSSADTWRPALENVGFAAPEIVKYLDILKLRKLHVSAFLHLDHAGAGGMGHSFSYASEVLFSPSIFSSGRDVCPERLPVTHMAM